MGNDFQDWRIPANDEVILAIADGIKSVDTVHPMTIQLNYNVSESQDYRSWIPRINTNGVTPIIPDVRGKTYVAYNKPTVMPVLFLEENYRGRGQRRGNPERPLYRVINRDTGSLDRRRFGRTFVRKLLDRQVRPCVATST